jgi:hypothetical protein
LKFENTEVFNFAGALRGMRNPMNSWSKSDSYDDSSVEWGSSNFYKINKNYHIGKDDLALAQRLIKAGGEHRKFMRQIFVSVDITAPLYWWKEFDTYKVGTVANSTSTMHKLTNRPITEECFEMDDFEERFTDVGRSNNAVFDILTFLEDLRQEYLRTKDKRYWKELVRWLPESWLQTRTITMNYENIFNIIKQRSNHKLNEWSGKDNSDLSNFISWARALPYANELLFISQEEDS